MSDKTIYKIKIKPRWIGGVISGMDMDLLIWTGNALKMGKKM